MFLISLFIFSLVFFQAEDGIRDSSTSRGLGDVYKRQKWHMGHDNDAPRKGFDHWASFKGQGVYFDPEFNINGSRKKFEGYNADVTADLALNLSLIHI